MRKENTVMTMDTHEVIGYRPTWAEVNLGNLAYNYSQIKKHLKPGTKVLVTVKADAYGHGLIPIAKKLISCGVDYFGVASIDEGIALRQEGITLPILVLGVVMEQDIAPLFKFGLIPNVCTDEFAASLDKFARANSQRIKVHIKVDTGMARIGVRHEEAYDLVMRIRKFPRLDIEGIFTHFAFADMNKDFTLYQIRLFDGLIERLKKDGLEIPLVHAANSMGVIAYRQGHFNMVRPGLVMYGLYPKEKLKITLKPVLSLKTKVVFTKRVPGGQGISYGHTYVTSQATTVITIPIGYGDGYPRNLSNTAPVLLHGKRHKISGRICMDQIMVDVGNARVKVGDEVVLIGCQGKDRISAEELADMAGTIPYEIVCGLGSRVPRIYFEHPNKLVKFFKQMHPEFDYGKDLIR